MTTKAFQLVEAFSVADRKDQKQVDGAIAALFDYIEELERKAQAYDNLANDCVSELNKFLSDH